MARLFFEKKSLVAQPLYIIFLKNSIFQSNFCTQNSHYNSLHKKIFFNPNFPFMLPWIPIKDGRHQILQHLAAKISGEKNLHSLQDLVNIIAIIYSTG